MARSLRLFYTILHPAQGVGRRRKKVPFSHASGEKSSKGSPGFCVVKNQNNLLKMGIIQLPPSFWYHDCFCYVWF